MRPIHPLRLLLGALLLTVTTSCLQAQAPPAAPIQVDPPAPANTAWRFQTRPGEFRGSWVHWEDYVSPAAIEATVAKAKRAGLNVLLPLANYPHQAMWRSAMLPTNPNVPEGFDPLRALVVAAHDAGLQVHPYLVTLHGGLNKHPGLDPEWFVVDRQGRRVDNWLNPAHPGVREFWTKIFLEVVQTGVDGISYDYIRHEYNSDYDYSDFTRRRFMEEQGYDPLVGRDTSGTTSGMRLLRNAWHQGAGAAALTETRTFLDLAGYHPTPVEAANLSQLSRRTVLVAGNLYADHLSAAVANELARFVRSGGALVILDGPSAARLSPQFAEAVGLSGASTGAAGPISVIPGDPADELWAELPASLEVAEGTCYPAAELAGATALAQMADGRPAVAWQTYGLGTVVTINYRIYAGATGRDRGQQQLLANIVDWLTERHELVNTAKATVRPEVPMTWSEWRTAQVTEMVRQISTAVRAARPEIIVSAAGGTRRSDVTGLHRDGLDWLRKGYVDFLCAMAYQRELPAFQKRLTEELAPLAGTGLDDRLYAGVASFWLEARPQQVVAQVEAARAAGLRGVCFFAFENINQAAIDGLRAGPFAQDAPVPFTMVPPAGALPGR